MRMTSTRFLAAIMLLSALVPVAPVGGADETAVPQAPAAAARVNERELKAFAKVYVEYQTIRRNYESKIARLKDEKEQQNIESEATEKVKQALNKQGLTPQSYNRIFAAVNGNPQLRQQALALINQERGKS